MSYEASDLIAGKPEPKYIFPRASLLSAIPELLDHNERFLPVVRDEQSLVPIGLLTSDSLANAIRNFGEGIEFMRVIDAAEKIVTYKEDAEVAEFLDDIHKYGAVAIVDKSDRLVNIITVNDTSTYFHALAYDMILLEDIEKSLRDHIEAAYTNPQTGDVDKKQLQSAINLVLNRDKPFEQLTLSESTQLFCHPRTWNNYGKNHFSITSKALSNLLDIVREIRNPWAHFRANPTPAQRKQLKFAQLWFKRNDPVYPTGTFEPVDIGEHQHPPKESTIDYGAEIKKEQIESGSSRYVQLANFLNDQPTKIDQLQLSFDQIEEILGFDLPQSAREHRAWWANDMVGHSWSKEWLDVDWRVASVNMSEQVVRFARAKERDKAYIDFFSNLIHELSKQTGFNYLKPQPDGSSWAWTKTFVVHDRSLASTTYSFGRGGIFRVELYIDCDDKVINKQLFDRLLARREEVEKELGYELTWQRLDHRRASRIARIFRGHITDSEKELSELRQKAIPAMVDFVQVMQPKVETIGKEIL